MPDQPEPSRIAYLPMYRGSVKKLTSNGYCWRPAIHRRQNRCTATKVLPCYVIERPPCPAWAALTASLFTSLVALDVYCINSLLELGRCLCHALAEQLGRFQITWQRAFFRRRIRRTLRHRARRRSQEIGIVALRRLAIGWHHAGANPNHGVLHRERKHIMQGRQLIAVHARRIGEI